jgi:uncharacterized membrane protein YtjA (UPF0391 family)
LVVIETSREFASTSGVLELGVEKELTARDPRCPTRRANAARCPEVCNMPGNLICYALVLNVIALVAALFGFGGVSATAMSGAHLFIWLAVVIVVVGVVFASVRRV